MLINASSLGKLLASRLIDFVCQLLAHIAIINIFFFQLFLSFDARGRFQGMQFQFADSYTRIEAARLLTYNAARLKEEGKPFTQIAAMAKLFSSQVAQEVSGSAIEWCGGSGFTRETGLEKYWRDSKVVRSWNHFELIIYPTLKKHINSCHVLNFEFSGSYIRRNI